MSAIQPAWSDQFASGTLREITPLEPLESITREWAWGDSTGQGVRVAIIDSGIDADHPAIGGRVEGYVAISQGPEGLIYNTEPHGDVFGHGNACAGIIRSLAPDCALYSIRVLGPGLSGQGAIFAAALRWAIEHEMHVCNLSLGTTRKDFFAVLHELADQAYFRNVLLITAANNMPIPSYPAMYASVISVAAHELKNPYLFYCNPHPPVEFGAPGIDLEVAWQRGGRITATGNSFAAPHIAGIVARILGKHPGLNLSQMKVILRALAANRAGGATG